MSRRRTALRAAALSLVLAPFVMAGAPALATTVCDTDPNATSFEATIDPNVVNNLLSGSDNVGGNPADPKLVLPGICVDHEVTVMASFFSLSLESQPFTFSTVPGSVRVDLDALGPFGLDFDGSRYRAINCSSICKVTLPYVGSIFDGCAIESGIVGPVLSLLHGSATWDTLHVTQIADTCVLGDCSAVSPTELSTVDLVNFDIDLTGFGSCEVVLDFPDPIPDPPAFDPCDGLDPIIAALMEPLIDSMFESAFVNRKGEGLLINAFSIEILKDRGCLDIPEVSECKASRQATGQASLIVGSGSRMASAALYLLPVVLAIGFARRMRRRKS
jgi:hypothetical protein